MPGITNPAEEYFKDGLWGWASTLWEKLVSSGGRLFTALHGWDGAAWRKLPLVWGYSGTYSEYEAANDVAAGDVILTFSTVPAGEVWVITAFAAHANQANASRAQLGAHIDGIDHWLNVEPLTAAFDSTIFVGQIMLATDDYLKVFFEGASLNDDFRAYAVGYKMKVAE